MVQVQQRELSPALPPTAPSRKSADGQAGSSGILSRIRRSMEGTKRMSAEDRKGSKKLIEVEDVEMQESGRGRQGGYDANYSKGLKRVASFVKNEKEEAGKKVQGSLGTLRGVFFPTLQNIFGIILFIRLSWITGIAGIGVSFMTVFTCCCCTFLTTLSLSAIATNGKVAAGGSYYMISRALGPAFGGAVGILFYLGTTVAAAMYILGAVEVVQANIPSIFGASRLIQSCTLPKAGGVCNPCSLLNHTMYCIENGLQNTFECMAVEASEQLCNGNRIIQNISDAFPTEASNFYVNADCCLFSINEARLYGTILAIVMTCVVLAGMKVVSIIAPFFLLVVVISIISIYLGFFTAARLPPVIGIDANLTTISGDLFLSNFFPIWANMSSVATNIDGAELSLSSYPEVLNLIKQFPSYSVLRQILVNPQSYGYMYMIGLFFPSVTGIMAGSNRSGDLRDPSVAIPRGTIAAVLVTTTVYLSHAVLWGTVAERSTLVNPEAISTIVASISFPLPVIVQAGIILSSVGAGLQSLAGAPRLLGAICSDNVIPGFNKIAPKSGKEPRIQVIITWFICNACILAGTLDVINPLITMFFLMCYAFTNLACFVLRLLQSPSFRPTWKFYHWSTSLLGFLLCIAVMFITSPLFAVIAIVIAIATFLLITFKGEEKNWGDGIQGLKFQMARNQLLGLQGRVKFHLKNWRPQMLVLIDTEVEDVDGKKVAKPGNLGLIAFANQLKKSRGMMIIGTHVSGNGRKAEHLEAKDAVSNALATLVKNGEYDGKKLGKGRLPAFPFVVFAEQREAGRERLVQTAGLGELVPNSILMEFPTMWRDNPAGTVDFLWLQHVSVKSNKTMMVVKGELPFDDAFQPDSKKPSAKVFTQNRTIDVWYNVHDGGLLLLLPYLLQRHRVWSDANLRVFTVADTEEDMKQLEDDLRALVTSYRINATVEVLAAPSSATTALALSSGNRTSLSKSRVSIDTKAASTLPKITEGVAASSAADGDAVVVAEKPPMKSSSDVDPFLSHSEHIGNAKALNSVIRERSVDASIVFLTLPLAAESALGSQQASREYLEYLDTLIEGLGTVVLGLGTGDEVITGFG